MTKFVSAVLILSAVTWTTGCAVKAHRPELTNGLPSISSPKMPSTATALGGGENDDGYSEILVRSTEDYTPRRVNESTEIPQAWLTNVEFNNTSLYDALTSIAAAQELNLVISAELAKQQGVYMTSKRGRLADVIDQLATANNFFYRFDNGNLYVSRQERFTVYIPPLGSEDMSMNVADMVTAMGGSDVKVDRRFNLVSYSADFKGSLEIEHYLKVIRDSGVMITYDTWVWEVGLADENKTGIAWDNLSYVGGDTILGGFANRFGLNAESAGALLNGNISTDRFNLDLFVEFLKTQGSLHTLSKPKISLLNGSESSFAVVENEEYLSELTNTISSSGDVTQSGTKTKNLRTGVEMKLIGSFQDGTVFSDIYIKISDLEIFNETETDSVTLRLPKTLDRELTTNSRVLPGSYIVLGGINTKRIEKREAGTPMPFLGSFFSIQTNNEVNLRKSELVIVMRPRVVKYVQTPEGSTS